MIRNDDENKEKTAMIASEDPYSDIIGLPHHVSVKRLQMPMSDRAAQFSPFAALTGYEEAIHETGRLTDRRLGLSEDEKAALDRKQQWLYERIAEHPRISVTYFIADEKKEGGTYVKKSGLLKKMDRYERWLMLDDGTRICMDDIYELNLE